jgi:hypothetical protein
VKNEHLGDPKRAATFGSDALAAGPSTLGSRFHPIRMAQC